MKPLNDALDAFIGAHPDGWGHEDWLNLLTRLREDGLDVEDPGEVGAELESRRLTWELRRRAVPGLGPKRIAKIADRFGSFWALREARADQVAELEGMPGTVAEKVVQAVR